MSIYQGKPLGSYACGGKCNPDGYDSEDLSFRKPCPKCRVYVVVPGEHYQHSDEARLVRARTGMEAIEIFEKGAPPLGLTKISVRLYNTDNTKSSATARYERLDSVHAWKRKLNRPSPEAAVTLLVRRTRQNMKIAMRDWKLDAATAAGAVKYALELFMKDHNLAYKKAS